MRGEKLNRLLRTDTGDQDQLPKGRSVPLLNRRDKCLLTRYHYYAHHKKKRFDDIMLIMADEFFLSQERIVDIISANIGMVAQLKEQKPQLYKLKNQWPQFKW